MKVLYHMGKHLRVEVLDEFREILLVQLLKLLDQTIYTILLVPFAQLIQIFSRVLNFMCLYFLGLRLFL